MCQRAGTARHIAHVNDRGQDADTGLHQESGGNAAARHDQVLGFVCDHAAVRDLVVIAVLVGVLVEQSLFVGVHINVPVPLDQTIREARLPGVVLLGQQVVALEPPALAHAQHVRCLQ